MTDDPVRLAFVCVQNAGRSQMATAFAERERSRRDIDVEILTGGTHPADEVHPEVVEAMRDVGVDLADRTPRGVSLEELQQTDLVVTMGCSAEDVCPAGWGGENRDWDLNDPDGRDPGAVRDIRDDVERRVLALFDEIEV